MSKERLAWTYSAWDDYQEWQKYDKKIGTRINRLLKEIQRTPFSGTGKPEPLRGNLSGYWSRRIDINHRLVYEVCDGQTTVISCREHY